MSKTLTPRPAAPAVEPGAFKLVSAAKYLGDLNPMTVRRLVDRGLLKPNRMLRHLVFSKAELDRFLAEGAK